MRDVAVAVELWQRYIDLLKDMEEGVEVVGDDSVVVSVRGVKLKLKSVEQIAEWISHGNEEP